MDQTTRDISGRTCRDFDALTELIEKCKEAIEVLTTYNGNASEVRTVKYISFGARKYDEGGRFSDHRHLEVTGLLNDDVFAEAILKILCERLLELSNQRKEL